MAYDINKTFKIYNADGTQFNGLELKKATVESVVMSLGDKISGDVYYNGSLGFTMQEYIVYDGVKYVLVNPPTSVQEGLVKENSSLKGMTKYSLVFYHPMYMLSNFPMSDKAVTQDEENYLSQNKTFYWIGNLYDFMAKLNVNLENTEWLVDTNIVPSGSSSSSSSSEEDISDYGKAMKMSDVLSFDKQFISDALKTAYDTWEIPFVIDQITDATRYASNPFYDANKKFVILFGLPTQEIYEHEGDIAPFVFRFGQGIGLKNNSRTPKNNKIVTRIVGYGSERNIPYGYPQIPWYGDSSATQTQDGYPIYKGIVGGQYVQLIKHPFTRKTLMPSVYSESVFNKVSPYLSGGATNPDYNPDLEIIDYYDANSSYPNPINPLAPSVEIHQFEDEYPHLGSEHILDAYPIDADNVNGNVQVTEDITSFLAYLSERKTASSIAAEKTAIQGLIDFLTLVNAGGVTIPYYDNATSGDYIFNCVVQPKGTGYQGIWVVYYESATFNIAGKDVIENSYQTALTWDDTMDDNGEYTQSYFKITLPQLSFDIYACASITEEMQINMRSGACLGCTFNVQVDWDDYKRNFYDSNGDFAPTGSQRDYLKYPDSSQGSIDVIVQKDLNTFGTLMPNVYQNPRSGDKFVVLGISLPLSYITNAEVRLDATMKQYMLENNVYYFEYPAKVDEHFLTTHPYILSQIKNNALFRFKYNNEDLELYIKQISIKYGESVLPQWDITLTDDIEVVLNKIGQTVDEIRSLRDQLKETQKENEKTIWNMSRQIESKTTNLGRFFYYAGTWESSDIEWVVSDTQAPYFDYYISSSSSSSSSSSEEDVRSFWLFNPPTNGTYTQAQMGTPHQGDGWELMMSDFKYLITEAVFGNYAHFGSAIINGDWLISQHGTINGVASTSYISFDPNHPNDNQTTNFIPNYCINLLTGASYQHDAYLSGTIFSNSGTIAGFNLGNVGTVPTMSTNVPNDYNLSLNHNGIKFQKTIGNNYNKVDIGVSDNIVAAIGVKNLSRVDVSVLCALQLGAEGFADLAAALDITSGIVSGLALPVTILYGNTYDSTVEIVCDNDITNNTNSIVHVRSGGIFIVRTTKTIKLPSAPQDGTMYTFLFYVGGSSDTMTIKANTGDSIVTIDSQTPTVTSLAYTSFRRVTFIYVSSNWYATSLP